MTADSLSGLDEIIRNDLVLPDELIPDMRQPLGELIEGESPSIEIQTSKKIVTVGDQCTLTLINEGMKPSLAIVDYKTKRERIEDRSEIEGFGDVVLKLTNPPGSIAKEAWELLRSAFQATESVRIDVEGEEDLLALPSIMLAPQSSIVLYGMPSKGLVIVHVNDDVKKKVSDLISRMVVRRGD